jgi:general nucleoside transport system permease protein
VTTDVAETPAKPAPPEKKDSFLSLFLKNLWSANTFTVTFLSIFLALVIGAVLIVISDSEVLSKFSYFTARPSDAFNASWDLISQAYGDLFKGSIFDPAAVQAWIDGTGSWQAALGPISETLTYATPLVFTGLSVAIAFRGGLFNIGGQGQAVMGCVLGAVAGFAFSLPPGIHLIVALLFGLIGGGLWGFLPGLLKARTGAHEVITTIMLNYVAYNLLGYLLTVKGFQAPNQTQATTPQIDKSAQLPTLFQSVHAGLIIALLAAAGSWWLLSRSTLGFSMRAIGANAFAARTAGMSTARGVILSMMICGALGGLVGCSQVLGTRQVLTQDVDAGFGFDAITVALLGRGTPMGTVLAGLLFGALRAGSVVMGSQTSTPPEIVQVIGPVIVLFIAAPALIRGVFRLRAARGGTGVGALAKGWNG